MEVDAERDGYCFCCGEKNVQGLHLQFSYPEAGKAETKLHVPEFFSGWKSITHGGFISMLLDESMAHACISANYNALTAQLQVRFIKPLATNQIVTVTGRIISEKGKLLFTEAALYNEQSLLVANAKGSFIKV